MVYDKLALDQYNKILVKAENLKKYCDVSKLQKLHLLLGNTHNNISYVYLRKKSYKKALFYCDLAIDYIPNYSKALERKRLIINIQKSNKQYN